MTSVLRQPPALSVVVPVHNEAANIAPLFGEIREVMNRIGRPYEVIYVNDGSTDATLDALRQLTAQGGVRVLDLDGNFGEAAALSAGFHAARGALVVTLDGDGQNDPRDIPALMERLEHGGYQVVSGWRRQRQASLWLRVLPSYCANRLIAAVTGVPLHDNGCGLKVYRGELVHEAVIPAGMHRFLPALLGVARGAVAEVVVTERRRQGGTSHYGIGRILAVLRDLVAVRLLIRDPDRSGGTWALAGLTAAAVTFLGVYARYLLLTAFAAGTTLIAATTWWNLRRFNRIRQHGAYRIRHTYGDAEPALVIEPGNSARKSCGGSAS
jgi:glycosyltransferase involved in cell wall biosynthesis